MQIICNGTANYAIEISPFSSLSPTTPALYLPFLFLAFQHFYPAKLLPGEIPNRYSIGVKLHQQYFTGVRDRKNPPHARSSAEASSLESAKTPRKKKKKCAWFLNSNRFLLCVSQPAPWNEFAFLFHWGVSACPVKLRKHYFTGARDRFFPPFSPFSLFQYQYLSKLTNLPHQHPGFFHFIWPIDFLHRPQYDFVILRR